MLYNPQIRKFSFPYRFDNVSQTYKGSKAHGLVLADSVDMMGDAKYPADVG